MLAPPPAAEQEAEDSLLVVILDVSPLTWGKQASDTRDPDQKVSLVKVCESLLAFLKSFQLASQHNQTAVLVTTPNRSEFAYTRESLETTDAPLSKSKKRKLGTVIDVDTHLQKKLHKIAAKAQASVSSGAPQTGVSLASGLALALCYSNRLMTANPRLQARILVIQGSPDTPSQYVSVMNSIFSAQKSHIPVDACVISDDHSTFLQQASDLTDGVYLKLKPSMLNNGEVLLEYLLCCFLADAATRKTLQLPRQAEVDYRASCFCHRKTIDMGFVCSVCLSTWCFFNACRAAWCTFKAICETCNTKQQKAGLRSSAPKRSKPK